MVSLGDLGRKEILHLPGDAGTSLSMARAKSFLGDFRLPYDVVVGNHDLEGMDEFETDEENLRAWMDFFPNNVNDNVNDNVKNNNNNNNNNGGEVPYYAREISVSVSGSVSVSIKSSASNSTSNSNSDSGSVPAPAPALPLLLVFLSSTRFRSSPHSSHEVYIDPPQLSWFSAVVSLHASTHRILVFSHAPPLGSGLRVLHGVHLQNGCAYLNHGGPVEGARRFLEIVKGNEAIKCWCSGHSHLDHDEEEAVSVVSGTLFLQVRSKD